MLSNFGTTEWVLIALVVLFLFGGKKLPELAQGIGDSVRTLRKSVKDEA